MSKSTAADKVAPSPSRDGSAPFVVADEIDDLRFGLSEVVRLKAVEMTLRLETGVLQLESSLKSPGKTAFATLKRVASPLRSVEQDATAKLRLARRKRKSAAAKVQKGNARLLSKMPFAPEPPPPPPPKKLFGLF